METSFRAARPVLFAGAVAVAWLTFSAPAGTADTGPVSAPTPDTVAAAASSLNSAAPAAAASFGSSSGPSAAPFTPAVPASALPAASVPLPSTQPVPVVYAPAPVTGLLQPLLEGPVGTVDAPMSSLVPVTKIDPVQTVAAAAESAGSLTEVLSPLVGDVKVPDPSLKPIAGLVTDPVQPVVGLVTDVAPLRVGSPLVVADFNPGEDSGLAGLVLPQVSSHGVDAASVSASAWSPSLMGAWAPGGLWPALLSTLLAAPAASFAGAGFSARDGAVQGSSSRRSSGRALLTPIPAPGAGSGPGQSSGGAHGSVAWLSNTFDDLPRHSVVPAREPLQHVPAPVSFDPGSSPD